MYDYAPNLHHYLAYQAKVEAESRAAYEALDAVDKIHHHAKFLNRVREIHPECFRFQDLPVPLSGGVIGRVAAAVAKINEANEEMK